MKPLSMERLYAAVAGPAHIAFPIGWRETRTVLLSKDGAKYAVCSLIDLVAPDRGSNYVHFYDPDDPTDVDHPIAGYIDTDVLLLADVPFVSVPLGSPAAFWPTENNIVTVRQAIGLFVEVETGKMIYVSKHALFPLRELRVFVGHRAHPQLALVPATIDAIRHETPKEIVIDLRTGRSLRLTRQGEPETYFGSDFWEASYVPADPRTTLISVGTGFLLPHPYTVESENEVTIAVKTSARLSPR